MIRPRFGALLAATAIAVPAFAQTQPPQPAPGAQPQPRVIVEHKREVQQRAQEIERERVRTQRDNRVEQTERVNHTFKIGGGGKLQVSNYAGDITITRGDGNEVRVEAVKTARARTEAQARELLPAVRVEFSERAGRAEVKTAYPSEQFGQSRQMNVGVSVSYAISAPQGTRIYVRTLAGNVTSTGIKGELSLVSISGDVRVVDGARVSRATSTSGHVEIRDVQSDTALEATSTSGNVMVVQSRAPRMELGTISGSVTIDSVQADQIEAHSLSGDVNVAFPFAKNGRYEFNSHSGNIQVALMGNTGFELDANSFSGNVQSAVSLVDRSGGDDSGRRGRSRRLRGRFGDGTAVLDITTFSGNVIVTKK